MENLVIRRIQRSQHRGVSINNQTFILEDEIVNGTRVGDNPHALPAPVNSCQKLFNQVALSTESGDCFLLEFNECNHLGTVDTGISSMAWSPDLELAVIITNANGLLLVTSQFDVVSEYANLQVLEETKQQDAPAILGWGKKETQFHGSAGTSAANAQQKQFRVGKQDHGKSIVSWRGDGNFFCVSVVVVATGKPGSSPHRIIYVFNRDGQLQSASEPIDLLQGVIAWRPSGNLIASCQIVDDTSLIVFFERNGLRHGEFKLPETASSIIKKLEWNADSSILAVQIDCPEKELFSILLYTVNNYHWYLSQRLDFPLRSILTMQWDAEDSAKLLGVLAIYEFTKEIITSTSLSPLNPGTAAVIDGATLQLTPFKFANTPPPMSLFTLSFESCVTHASFAAKNNGDDLIVLTNDGIVHLYESLVRKGSFVSPRLIGSMPVRDGDEAGYSIVRAAFWIAPSIIAVICDTVENGDFVQVIHFNEKALGEKTTALFETRILTGGIQQVHYNIACDSLIIQKVDGSLYKLSKMKELEYISKFPTLCTSLSLMNLVLINGESKVVALGQSQNKLYVDSEIFTSDCISYTVHSDFLIISSHLHTARFIPISAMQKFSAAPADITKYNENNRRVERGSKIVLAVPGDALLIFQMPRGNLETICPRALILASLRIHLDALEYKTAFVLSRKHRIDLNLLFDHDPLTFLARLSALDGSGFVQALGDPDHLNLFLSGLRSEDVTISMFPTQHALHARYEKNDKIDIICEMVRKSLIALNDSRFRTSILTTFVRHSVPRLEDAMLMIKSIRDTESIEAAEAALKYTIFLVDVDSLYNIALGMYDFSLVLMVAQRSQKDPREYLSFLTNLRKMDTYAQRFAIDDFLGKHEKALDSLRMDKLHVESLEYIEKHELYKYSVKLFRNDGEIFCKVLFAYASFLLLKSDLEEAAIMYRAAGELDRALEAYKSAGLWKEAIAVAYELKLDTHEINEIALALCHSLSDQKKFADAAYISLHYLKDIPSSVKYTINGSFFSEATMICYTENVVELLDLLVKPGIIDAADTMQEDIKSSLSTFQKQVERLKDIRIEKVQRIANALLMPVDETLNDIDIMSDTTSMATTRITSYTGISGMSSASGFAYFGFNIRRTSRTGKGRRKLERKKGSSRKGGVYEEEFLISSIQNAVEKCNSMATDILNVSKNQLVFGMIEDARVLQQLYRQMKEAMSRAIDDLTPGLRLSPEDYAQSVRDKADDSLKLTAKVDPSLAFLI